MGVSGASAGPRRLTLDDVDEAARVLRASYDERLPWLAGLHTPEEDRAFLRGPLFARCALWGAFDGEMVGMIAFRPGWVDQLYVLPGRQGGGHGGALLGVAMAANAGLSLRCFERNAPARRFYEGRGFVAVERTDGSGNEEREPDVLYRWERVSAPAAD